MDGKQIEKCDITCRPGFIFHDRDVDSYTIQCDIETEKWSGVKQMTKKLLYLDKEPFGMRVDKGSEARDQLYFDCSTGCYEYFRFHLIRILKDRFKCEEDVAKRKLVTDANMTEKSEVESQYSIKFTHNNVQDHQNCQIQKIQVKA